MEIYLIDNETNEIKQTYQNVEKWAYNFVEFTNGGRCKIYCDIEKEHFSNEKPELMEVENANN